MLHPESASLHFLVVKQESLAESHEHESNLTLEVSREIPLESLRTVTAEFWFKLVQREQLCKSYPVICLLF